MTDMLGNTITEGGFLWWKSKDMLVRVAQINEDNHPPLLSLIVLVPVSNAPRNEPVSVPDFLCVVNPDQERIIEGMLEKQRRQ